LICKKKKSILQGWSSLGNITGFAGKVPGIDDQFEKYRQAITSGLLDI